MMRPMKLEPFENEPHLAHGRTQQINERTTENRNETNSTESNRIEWN